MARMQYDPETKQVKDVSPGRSVYLSNKQWAALNEYLEMEQLWTDLEVSGGSEDLTSALRKLLKISEEVVNK